MSYSKEIARAVKEHLNENMKMVAEDDDGTFSFVMHFPGLITCAHYLINVRDDSFAVHAILPIAADKNNPAIMGAASEFINRANYSLMSGNFEMNYSSGEIRYKCYTHCGEQIPSDEVIGHSIAVPGAMINRYAPGLINVLFKNVPAEKAVDQCEKEGKSFLKELEKLLKLEKLLSDDDDTSEILKQIDEDDPDSDSEIISDSEAAIPSLAEFLRRMATKDDIDLVQLDDEEETA